MLTDVKIWLYEFPKCGYFTFRGNTPALFGGISQTFDALTSWASGKQLGETSTFSTEEPDGTVVGGAYFLDIAKHTNGDFLIGIWNRLPGNKNNITSVGVGDVVGSASAAETVIDRNRIPGFATYFWVMPAEQRIACLRLKHETQGLDAFKKYMLSFLKNLNPQNVIQGPPGPNGELNIVGYRPDTTTTTPTAGAFPKLSVKSIVLSGDITYLRHNAAAIDKVLSKTTLSSESPGDFQRWQKVMDISRFLRTPPPLREESLIRLEFPMSFTTQELDDAISSWQDREGNSDASDQDDLGFHLRTGETKWLSKSQARVGYQIDVMWTDAELVNVTTLLSQLQVYRSAVLALG